MTWFIRRMNSSRETPTADNRSHRFSLALDLGRLPVLDNVIQYLFAVSRHFRKACDHVFKIVFFTAFRNRFHPGKATCNL